MSTTAKPADADILSNSERNHEKQTEDTEIESGENVKEKSDKAVNTSDVEGHLTCARNGTSPSPSEQQKTGGDIECEAVHDDKKAMEIASDDESRTAEEQRTGQAVSKETVVMHDKDAETHLEVDENGKSTLPNEQETGEDLEEEYMVADDGADKRAEEHVIVDQTEECPSPETKKAGNYSWMQQGTKIMVKTGKEGIPYAAWVMDEPFPSLTGDSWLVSVKWDGWTTKTVVECAQCEEIDTSSGKRACRRRVEPSRFMATSTTSKKRTSPHNMDPPVKLPSGEELDAASTTVVTPEKKKQRAADADQGGVSLVDNADVSENPLARTTITNKTRYEDAKQSLLAMEGMTEQEVVEALKFVGPPYGLQTVMQAIEENRRQADDVWTEPNAGTFQPYVGMRVRKVSGGNIYYGTVTGDAELCRLDEEEDSKSVLMWEVTFDGGDAVDDMDWHELFRCRVDRPRKPAPCRGRQLQFLELFSGQGVVSQEFCDRKWNVASIDSAEGSNATIKKDILSIRPEDLDVVPDCIWASPPCETYSRLSGGYHRAVGRGEFEISDAARKHNFLFQRMAEIMHWAKKKHPHLIVVIENPVGSLRSMPLMRELTKSLGLYSTTVHYCAFGRDDKKPTDLWTNDFGLYATLSEFTCENKCPYSRGTHPIGVRQHGHLYHAAAIPQPLAEEVAEYVQSKFYQDRIRFKPVVSVAGDT